jgi:ionotropic glutamate receptor
MTVKQIELNSRENNIGYQSGSLGVIVNLNFSGVKPYRSAEEYSRALSEGSKHGGVSAIIDEVPYIKIFLAKYSADYAMIKPQSITNGFAFVSYLDLSYDLHDTLFMHGIIWKCNALCYNI